MTILEFKKHFKSELSGQYSESESAFLYSIFGERILGFDLKLQRRFAHQELLIQDQERLDEIIQELKSGKPYQHILGETEFFGETFSVNEHVLIPRPETEELLELAISEISNFKFQISNPKILDIGTGSGIIPIILKKKFPNAEISALDVSEKALEKATENAKHHHVEIHFQLLNFLYDFPAENFDIIISNPPYIGIDEENKIHDSVKNFEPKMALFSPIQDPLIFYRRIAEFAKNHVNENGMIFLEINQKLGQETLQIFQDFSEAQLLKDISGNDRIIFVQK